MDIENLKNELRALGFTEDKIDGLMDLAAQEALDTAMEDLGAMGNDAILEELEQAISDTTKDNATKLNMVFEKVYGMNAEAKKAELLTTYLKEVIEDTKKAKDLYTRYQAGDPAAVAQIKAQEGNPDVQAIVDQMK
jgi:hypothetical protein